MVDVIGKGYVVQHCITFFRKRQEELLYRSYVADALYCLNNAFVSKFGGSEISTRFINIVMPKDKEEDDRTGDEIAADIILRAGLSFGGNDEQEEPPK